MNVSAYFDINKTMNTFSTRADQLLRLFVTLLVLAYPAATLFINHGDSYTLGLLTIIGIWVWIWDSAHVWLNRYSGMLCLAFTLLFIVVVLSYVTGYQTEAGFHFLGRYLRFFFILPAYLAFRRYPPTAKTVFIGLALGALTAGIMASLEFMYAQGPIRIDAETGLSIIFGDLATTMVLCIVAGFGLMAASSRNWSVPLLILCLTGGVAATLLSGTRGAWLPLFLLIPALATSAAGFLKRRYLFAIMIMIIAIFCSSYFVTRIDTQGRLKDAVHNLKDYFVGLTAFNHQHNQRDKQIRCDNQSAFLKAWVNMYPANHNSSLVNSIEMDPELHQLGFCQYGYAIEMQNNDPSKGAWYYFPRIPANGSTQFSRVLVRGAGIISLDGESSPGIHFDTSTFTIKEIMSKNVSGTSIFIFVPPEGKINLVPLDSYPGEYSLSIADTSVGKRIEMWRAGWRLFLTHPVLGVGTGAYKVKTNELIQTGQVAPFIATYDHPHNDYVDALSSRGILGILALLVILLVPAGRFMQAIRSPDRRIHAVGMAGMLTITGFAIFALTDTIFLHSIMITWYVIYMALFYALLDSQAVLQVDPKQTA
ncbi:MAG TPA: O-antigen ligase family protein [Gammaproteobacteria bacterium]|nr:O-antigen ligase family protein [Gammaproteobacteria bacterium]